MPAATVVRAETTRVVTPTITTEDVEAVLADSRSILQQPAAPWALECHFVTLPTSPSTERRLRRGASGHPGRRSAARPTTLTAANSGEISEHSRDGCPLELVENQVVAGITIGGRGPFACLLDTAVAPSVVDLALARELRLHVRDDVPGEAAGQGSEGGAFYPSELPDVWLGELEVGDIEAVAADLSRLGSKLNRPLHAILGQSFFEGRWSSSTTGTGWSDFSPHGFERGLCADIEGAADLTPVVTVRVNAASVPVVLDTGSS